MSLISLSYCFGVVLGPLLGGVMSDRALLPWFNFSVPFLVAMALSLVAFIWLWFGYEENERLLCKKKYFIFAASPYFH